MRKTSEGDKKNYSNFVLIPGKRGFNNNLKNFINKMKK